MSERLNRFLGGSPLSVLLRLVLLSIAVGLVLSWLQWTPMDIIREIVFVFERAWSTVFGSLDRALHYFLLGAAIVVPIFLISRLFSSNRR